MDIKILNAIQENIQGGYISIILFGSYGRGDYNEFSDIDVLQITDFKAKSYSYDNINYSTYTFEQLVTMAQNGDLFVLHILMEGKLLLGSVEAFELLKNKFVKPINYKEYRSKLISCAALLCISNEEFEKHSMDFYRLFAYLFRSFLYSLMLDRGNLKYSVRMLGIEFKDKKIEWAFSFKNASFISYFEFVTCKELFENYCQTNFKNIYHNNYDLLKEFKENDEFGFRIGMHFLKDYADELYW